HLKFKHAKDDVLKTVPKWQVDMEESFVEDGAAFISIHSSDPDLLADVDSSSVAMATKARSEAMRNVSKEIMNDTIPWTVISIPRSEEHTSELQSRFDLVCRLLLEKKKKTDNKVQKIL